MTEVNTSTNSTVNTASAWSPLKIPMFRMLWIATLVSNIGTWMHDIGAGWLMTSLSPSPVMVALVQTATTLPMFLLALPAGALSDIIDRRRYLIGIQIWMALVAGLLGFFTLTGVMTAWSLVALTFAMGVGSAMMMPAWAALAPELVPRSELQPAIALNSLGVNVARAIGPAIAGVIVSLAGTGAVFVLNALSFLGIIYVLYRWQRVTTPSPLPTERFFSAMRSGFRFAIHAPDLQAAVIRGLGFFVFASSLWALLPLVAKNLPNGGAQTFGLLVASIGLGAVAGALVLPKIRTKVSRDILVAVASAFYALSMIGLATLENVAVLCLVMLVSGAAWISVLSSLQVAAQLALPSWVRSRGLAVFMMTFMGSMALGSLMWGKIAELYGIPVALIAASIGAIIGITLSWRWRLGGMDAADLSPSMHWPEPIVHDSVTNDRGPVLVTIEYDVEPVNMARFLEELRTLGSHRRRDGAFFHNVYEHTEKPNRMIETFGIESWLEHLRQHERVTDADRVSQARIQNLLVAGTEPRVAHYVAPDHQHKKENT